MQPASRWRCRAQWSWRSRRPCAPHLRRPLGHLSPSRRPCPAPLAPTHAALGALPSAPAAHQGQVQTRILSPRAGKGRGRARAVHRGCVWQWKARWMWQCPSMLATRYGIPRPLHNPYTGLKAAGKVLCVVSHCKHCCCCSCAHSPQSVSGESDLLPRAPSFSMFNLCRRRSLSRPRRHGSPRVRTQQLAQRGAPSLRGYLPQPLGEGPVLALHRLTRQGSAGGASAAGGRECVLRLRRGRGREGAGGGQGQVKGQGKGEERGFLQLATSHCKQPRGRWGKPLRGGCHNPCIGG